MVHTHATRAREADLVALDRTLERMRRMVMAHATALPEPVGPLPFEVAAMRATEAVAALVAEGATTTITDVARYLGLDHSTTSRAVGSAERAGLLQRVADEADRRRVALSLTEKGALVVEEIPRLRRGILETALADWQPDEVATFRVLLERFRMSVEDCLMPQRP